MAAKAKEEKPAAAPKKPSLVQEAFDGAVANTKGLDVERLMKVRRQYADEEALAEARKKGTDTRLLEALWAEGVIPGGGGFKSEKYNLSASIGIKETKTISRAKLILAGVDPEKIDAATVTSYSDPFVSLRSTSKGEEE